METNSLSVAATSRLVVSSNGGKMIFLLNAISATKAASPPEQLSDTSRADFKGPPKCKNFKVSANAVTEVIRAIP